MDALLELIAVRHGESVANAAFAEAAREGREDVGITSRDADVPLSPLGERQSVALGRWVAGRPDHPDLVVCSPYRRARQTSDAVLDALVAARGGPELSVDERLRDRDLGVLEMLTLPAIVQRFPDEDARRRRQGMLYWRPAGGESMMDVALRVRAFLADLRREPTRRVLLVTHDAVVLMLRYVVERLTEDDLGDIAPVLNAGVTRWTLHNGRLRLAAYNDTGHLA
ncbi:MAG TPA: histidine phosphatase family protein [Micromonosporaceae bacterium]